MTRTRSATRGAASVAMAALLVPTLAGCWQGESAETLLQGASGNGATADSATIRVDAATLVADGDRIRLIGRILNVGAEPDALEGITTAPSIGTTTISGGAVELPARTPVDLSAPDGPVVQGTGVRLPVSAFVTVTLSFRVSADVRFQALVVPPTGMYESVAPTGAATASPSPTEPAASPTAASPTATEPGDGASPTG